jgi:serine/threonine protein kinase
VELLVGDRLGKYEVLGRLAAGGMAEVYLARSLGHGGFAKTVALKRMLPELASEAGFREMFMQEAAVAARLNHPHIVQIFDFSEDAGELFLAMELVHGVTLRTLQRDSLGRPASEGLRIPPLLAAHLARCVARALAYAWQVPDERGEPLHLIHRDVSPHNILLSYEGDAKLADFGIARPAGRLTSAGMLKGKLLYMAPEQLLGQPLDARCDLFALGIVLYEAAMNLRKPLFDAGTEEGVKRAILERHLVPPGRMDPGFPRSLSQVIMKALERDREKRFASAAELADALGEVIHREAKKPQDHDLMAFMRRLYGEPRPIRTPTRPRESAEPRGRLSQSELERRGDDPRAATLPQGDGSEERARTVGSAGEPTASARRPVRRALGLGAGALLMAAGIYGATRAGAAGSRGLDSKASPDGAWLASEGPGSGAALDMDAGLDAGGGMKTGAGGDAGADIEALAELDAGSGAPEVGFRPGPTPARTAVPARRVDKPQMGWVLLSVKPWGFAWLDDEPYVGGPDQTAQPTLRRAASVGRHVMHWGRAGCGFYEREITVPAGRDGLVIEVVLNSSPTCSR